MKEIKQHQHGPCMVQYGSIYDMEGLMVEKPAVILDISEDPEDILHMLGYGSAENIRKKYDTMREKYIAAGFPKMAETLVIIRFDTLTGFADYDRMTDAKFTTDEICTLINWLCNSIYVKDFNNFLVSEDAAHNKLAQLASFGF